MRVLLLTRGELYRFGIDAQGLHLQRAVFDSIFAQVIRPWSTLRFQLVVGVDTRRNYPMEYYTGAVFFGVVGDARAEYRLVNESTQAGQFAALVARVSSLLRDYLFVMRHDVRVLRPLRAWGCGANPFASALLPGPITDRLVNDLYMGVPRAVHGRLFKLLFGPTRCWSLNSTAWAAQTGHFCGQVFREAEIPHRTCNATSRVRHHSPNYTTHMLPECETIAPAAALAWRCGLANGAYYST
jgi:hypothetical protein